MSECETVEQQHQVDAIDASEHKFTSPLNSGGCILSVLASGRSGSAV